MNIDEEATMKDFYKSIDFEKMDKNAKKKARLSILITMPLTLLSIFFLTISWNNEDIFLNNIYSILFCVPIWIALFCSILSYKFTNGLALERLSMVIKPLIYLVFPIPLMTIIKTDIFNVTQQDPFFLIFMLLATTIGFGFILYLLVLAIYYEKQGLSMEEYFKKQGLSEEEIRELKETW